ncbi:MAG: glycosyltransferase [Candidatus Limnocylindrales bacterium]
MRIAYVAHLNDGRGSGVVAKVRAQLAQWRRAGNGARLFVATADADTAWTTPIGDVQAFAYGGPASRLAAMARLVRGVRAFRPDVIYVRWDLFYPPMVFLPRGVPVVVEVNTDDRSEDRLGRRTRAVYNDLTRGFALGRAAGLVFVTEELSRLPSFRRFTDRRIVITNGIDLDDYPSLEARASGAPRIAFIGTPAPWHGIDKLERLAAARPSWAVDVVGMDDPGGAPPNIAWHGTLERPAVLEVLARADVGVGTLALHRKDLDEASPLKIREYLAVGLPVLYAYHDPDADRLDGYVLRVPNKEAGVDDSLDRIDAFVIGARGLRVPREAVAHLGVAAKEAQRLALLDAVATT